MSDNRKTCLMVGRCFTTEVGYLLIKSEQFRRDYKLKVYSSVGTSNFEHDFHEIIGNLPEASLIIYQPIVWATWGDDELYKSLMNSLPAGIKQITFPYPVFHTLWPYHHNDPHRAATWRHPFDDNTLLYAYGDANVARMVNEGMTAPEIVAKYAVMDLPAMIDLQHLTANVIELQRAKEADTDVKILDFLLEKYKSDRVFVCVNHGSNLLMAHMANQILGMLDYLPLRPNLIESLFELVDPEIPIHPSIVRYFDLKWVRPNMRYRIDRRRNLTFEDWVYELATPGDAGDT
jgi:hypothetical protein